MTTEMKARVTPADVLLAARLLLAGPTGEGTNWRKDVCAATRDGQGVSANDRDACCFDAVGVVLGLCGVGEYYRVNAAGIYAIKCLRQALDERIGDTGPDVYDDWRVQHYNDAWDTSWWDIESLFVRAEEIAQGLEWK